MVPNRPLLLLWCPHSRPPRSEERREWAWLEGGLGRITWCRSGEAPVLTKRHEERQLHEVVDSEKRRLRVSPVLSDSDWTARHKPTDGGPTVTGRRREDVATRT